MHEAGQDKTAALHVFRTGQAAKNRQGIYLFQIKLSLPVTHPQST
jgi:hypothetical protein